MIRRISGAGLAAVASLALAAPAQAQTSDQYWFHCTGPSKVQTAALSLAFPAAMWNTTKPSTSFQAGAGCGFLDAPGPVRPSTIPTNAYDAFFQGVHSKAIASMKLELHNLVTSRARQGDSVTFNVRLSEGSGTTATTLATKDVTVKPALSSTGATERMDVELTGLKVKAGPADRVLTITVHTESAPQAWVLDATEIPANVIFTEPAPVVAPAAGAKSATKSALRVKRLRAARR